MKVRIPFALASSLLFAFAACSDDGSENGTTDVPGPDASKPDSASQKDSSVPFDAATTDSSTADAASIDATASGDASSDGSATDASSDASKDSGSVDAGIDAASDGGASDASVGDSSVVDSGPNCPSSIVGGTLATFDFANPSQPGNQASTAAKSSAAGLTTGAISRSNNVTAQSGTNSINSSNWALTQTPDATKYYTFTLTPDPRCKLSLSGLSIDTQASGTGPAKASVATSDDSFVAMSAIAPNSIATPSLSVVSTSKAVEVRVYGYAAGGDAGSTGGTFRIQNTFTIKGSLQ